MCENETTRKQERFDVSRSPARASAACGLSSRIGCATSSAPSYENHALVPSIGIVHQATEIGVHQDACSEIRPLRRGMSIGVLTTVDTCHYRPTVLVIDCDNVTDMGFVPV